VDKKIFIIGDAGKKEIEALNKFHHVQIVPDINALLEYKFSKKDTPKDATGFTTPPELLIVNLSKFRVPVEIMDIDTPGLSNTSKIIINDNRKDFSTYKSYLTTTAPAKKDGEPDRDIIFEATISNLGEVLAEHTAKLDSFDRPKVSDAISKIAPKGTAIYIKQYKLGKESEENCMAPERVHRNILTLVHDDRYGDFYVKLPEPGEKDVATITLLKTNHLITSDHKNKMQIIEVESNNPNELNIFAGQLEAHFIKMGKQQLNTSELEHIGHVIKNADPKNIKRNGYPITYNTSDKKSDNFKKHLNSISDDAIKFLSEGRKLFSVNILVPHQHDQPQLSLDYKNGNDKHNYRFSSQADLAQLLEKVLAVYNDKNGGVFQENRICETNVSRRNIIINLKDKVIKEVTNELGVKLVNKLKPEIMERYNSKVIKEVANELGVELVSRLKPEIKERYNDKLEALEKNRQLAEVPTDVGEAKAETLPAINPAVKKKMITGR